MNTVKKRKYLLTIFVIILIIIIGVILIIHFVPKKNTKNLIESSININLPAESKIEKFSYSILNGSYYAKVSIDSKDVNNVKNQLQLYFQRPEEGKFTDQINFDDCKWWDMDNNSIDTFYNTMVGLTKTSHETRDVWAFVMKEIDGKFYLYIAY